MIAATLYSILRVVLDAIATSQRDQAQLQAEVLERQIKRVKWTPADRMVLAALRDRLLDEGVVRLANSRATSTSSSAPYSAPSSRGDPACRRGGGRH